MSVADSLLNVRVKSIAHEAQGVNSYELVSMDAAQLPAFTAGAHIDLHLPNGIVRSYSLRNAETERHRYQIAVNKCPSSRGGSRFMHETLRAGDALAISRPRNNFPLAEHARHSVLIAGGIGITPFLCMIQRLRALGRSWQLHYAARSPQKAAFLEQLYAYSATDALGKPCVQIGFTQANGARPLDVERIVAESPHDAHLYCCGPIPMLEAFERASGGRESQFVHVEYFTAKQPPASTGGFTVQLARSGRTIPVPHGKTILDALLDAGVEVQYSCMEGVCASCETPVIEGLPDHRDLVLSKEERARNNVMMICCSGSKSERLVLDL